MRIGRRGTALLATACLCGFVTSGACVPPSGESEPTRIPARRNAWIEDVPVPLDFTLNEKRSIAKVYPSRRIRLIDHYYEGSGQIGAMRNFYLERMPEHGWNMLKEELQEAAYTLRFRGKEEFCEVRIRRGGADSLIQPVEIRVQIEPEEPGRSPGQ
jgi:hypothetical protein